ncbi:MAG TPA: ParB/Srx family N-terminal domain-containing protein [Stellaceae bacterium]|nr:ParB/Srx family N-terminal domain-containing protein [Stellaceae bacterium]
MSRAMQTELVQVADLRPPPRNVRAHPEYQVAELARAVEKFGQTRPVIIDEDNMILAGNGLVLAHQRLGRAEISAHRVVGLSKTDKSKLMLSDNRIFALGIDDNGAILEEIRALDDFDIPGFDAAILEKLTIDTSDVTNLAMTDYGVLPEAAVELARAQGEAGEDEAGDAAASSKEAICPACGHVFRPRQ